MIDVDDRVRGCCVIPPTLPSYWITFTYDYLMICLRAVLSADHLLPQF